MEFLDLKRSASFVKKVVFTKMSLTQVVFWKDFKKTETLLQLQKSF